MSGTSTPPNRPLQVNPNESEDTLKDLTQTLDECLLFALLARIQSGNADARDLAVARAYINDNRNRLANTLPGPMKQAIVDLPTFTDDERS